MPNSKSRRELASTLADLNRHHGVTHRDIKPDNLFWLEGHAMVGDFGIAHHVDNAALTDAGNKAGPWGYIAPEALNNGGVDNWAPADVYSLAKSLWKFATGDPYPPQGTLLVFERHNCLHRVGGKAAFKLARLLEVCTAHNPHDRPSMRVLRDELQCWLNEHPADTVARPKPTKNASFYDPGHIMRKAARGGEDAIVDRCVRDILNPLRELFPGSSELTPASAGDLHPTAEIEHLVTQGDPDYMRDFDATLGLEWLHHPEARVIVQGIGTNDDAVYYGQWQTRPTAGGPWTPATPMRHTSGRLWFPTDHSARSMLSTQLADDKP
jgi:serine/threonine protein kinase